MATTTISSNSNDNSSFNSFNSNMSDMSNGNSTPAKNTATPAHTATDFNTNNNNNTTTTNNHNKNSSNMVGVVTKLFAQQNIHDVPSALLNQVSPEDREESLYEVHGVSLNDAIDETPAFVEEKKRQLAIELQSSISSSTPSASSSISASMMATNNTGNNAATAAAAQEAGGGGGGGVSRRGYELALQSTPPEVMDRQYLCFLRADHFNVSRAAARCLKHYDAKLKYFGPALMGTELGYKHLQEEDKLALQQGAIQLLTKRDRSGRAIIVQFAKIGRRCPIEIVAKLLFWSGIMASRDETVQKRGIVFIYYEVQVHEALTSRLFSQRGPHVLATIPCFPSRIVAMHPCTDNFVAKTAFSMATYYLEARFLCRMQTHWGSHTECQYSLMTFGIPLSTLPIREDNNNKDGGGTIRLDLHHAWLARLIQAEEQQEQQERQLHDGDNTTTSSLAMDPSSSSAASPPPPPPPPIFQPGTLDIIMGRGLRGRKYPGNQIFKRLLEERRKEYDSTSRLNKAGIVKEVYMILRRKHGCRFLSPAVTTIDENTGETIITEWVEVSEKESLDRISHGFRNLRNKK